LYNVQHIVSFQQTTAIAYSYWLMRPTGWWSRNWSNGRIWNENLDIIGLKRRCFILWTLQIWNSVNLAWQCIINLAIYKIIHRLEPKWTIYQFLMITDKAAVMCGWDGPYPTWISMLLWLSVGFNLIFCQDYSSISMHDHFGKRKAYDLISFRILSNL